MRARRNIILRHMRERRTTDDELHWESLVRTMIEMLGAERFDEIVAYVIAEMNAERQRLLNFAVETRRASH